jgi:hypothetical protein
MTEQRTTVRIIALEQAIQTVVHDLRVPEKLRTALAVYQDVSNDPNYHEIDTPRTEQTEPACLGKPIHLILWHNNESLDWSIEIDGQRHEHVTSEVMEALVECALIVAQMSLTRASAQRPQQAL